MPKAEVARRPDPQPLETDDRWVVVAGTVLWLVTFVVLLAFFRSDLRRHHTEWWLWSCWIGVALGLYGFRFVTRRQRALARESGAAEPGERTQE
jgi:hypothetical protein